LTRKTVSVPASARQRGRVFEVARGDVHPLAEARARLVPVPREDARPLASLEEALDDARADISSGARDQMNHALSENL
jgi:hypothetical protein